MTDFWLPTPKVKIYEALGAVADERLFDLKDDSVNVYSSRRDKFYHVKFNQKENAITSNDNSSYYVGYLGYPGISFLLARGLLDYQPALAGLLKNVEWKEINQKYKNDFEKALELEVLHDFSDKDKNRLNDYTESLITSFNKMSLKKLGTTQVPPEATRLVS